MIKVNTKLMIRTYNFTGFIHLKENSISSLKSTKTLIIDLILILFIFYQNIGHVTNVKMYNVIDAHKELLHKNTYPKHRQFYP